MSLLRRADLWRGDFIVMGNLLDLRNGLKSIEEFQEKLKNNFLSEDDILAHEEFKDALKHSTSESTSFKILKSLERLNKDEHWLSVQLNLTKDELRSKLISNIFSVGEIMKLMSLKVL